MCERCDLRLDERPRGREVAAAGLGACGGRFAEDGRCEDLRETWLFEPGDHAPHGGWGA